MKRTELRRKTPLRSGKPLARHPVGRRTPSELPIGLGLGVGGRPLSELRRSTLAARKPLARRTPLRQVSKKRAREIRERRAILQAKYPGVTLCEVPYCNRVADDAHEPLTRARGGSITDPRNVKAVCRPHHDEITFEEPGWAYDRGFLVHSWDGAA